MLEVKQFRTLQGPINGVESRACIRTLELILLVVRNHDSPEMVEGIVKFVNDDPRPLDCGAIDYLQFKGFNESQIPKMRLSNPELVKVTYEDYLDALIQRNSLCSARFHDIDGGSIVMLRQCLQSEPKTDLVL